MNSGSGKEIGTRTILLARFSNPIAAEAARDAIDAIIEAAVSAVDALFESRGGEADAADVIAIYVRHGLGEALGWESEPSLAASGSDIAWSLPPGADEDEAEQLVRGLGALHVAFQDSESGDEEWRATPHPMILPLPGEEPDPFEGDDDDPPAEAGPNRTLH